MAILMPTSHRAAAAVLLLVTLGAAPVAADLEISWRKNGNDVRGGGALRLTEWISGARHREDQGPLGKPATFSVIRNLEKLREIRVWHAFRFMIVHRLRPRDEALAAEERLAASRTGATETILDRLCHEYRYTASTADGSFTLKGTFWVPDEGPGVREYTRIYERLRELRVGEAKEEGERRDRPATHQRVELYGRFYAAARQHGIPYRMAFEITGPGTAVRVEQEAERISTAKVPSARFVAPSNYTVRR